MRSVAAAAGLLRSCIPRALMPGLLEQLQRRILGRIVAGFALAPMVSRRFLEIRLLRRRKRSRQTRTTFSATAC